MDHPLLKILSELNINLNDEIPSIQDYFNTNKDNLNHEMINKKMYEFTSNKFIHKDSFRILNLLTFNSDQLYQSTISN